MNRKFERRPHLVEIVLESASGHREARLSELSWGGCFIDTIAEAPIGEIVSFEIKDQGQAPLRFSGEVIYTFPGIGMGLKFTEVPSASREFLRSVLGDPGSSRGDHK